MSGGADEGHSERSLSDQLPSIHWVLPLNSEIRWSDLLAVLIETDPGPFCELLELGVRANRVIVQREISIHRTDRPDLILRADDTVLAVVEIKVLSGLGLRQLERYEASEPAALRYILLSPKRLLIDTSGTRWRAVTWEAVLDAYTESPHPWVSTTARAWRSHLSDSLPKVDAKTRWNDLTEGEDFVVAMKARAIWVLEHLDLPPTIDSDVRSSSAGASSVVRMYRNAAKPGYLVLGEAEERLGVRSIPKLASKARPPIGPSVRVALLQENVSTSAGFDWDYLLAMWPVMSEARTDWVRHAPRPRSDHDRANHRAMVAKGGPAFLGVGFGEAQAKITRQCVFGARFQLAPDIALGDLVTTLRDTAVLLQQMAEVVPPKHTQR